MLYYEITEAHKDLINNSVGSIANITVEIFGRFFIYESPDGYVHTVSPTLLDFLASESLGSVDWATYKATLKAFDFDGMKASTDGGFDAYRELIGRINVAGGLVGDQTKLDAEISIYIGYSGAIGSMVVPISQIRNMLKDGFFEWAVRSVEHYSDSRATVMTDAFRAEMITVIRETAKNFGRIDPVLDFAQNTPKGTLV